MLDKIEELYNQGITHFNYKDYVKAQSCFKMALEMLPNDAQLNQAMAIVLANLKEFESAKSCYEIALKAVGANPPINLLIEYGYLLNFLGEYDRSASVYETVLKRDPSFVEGWVTLADNYSALRKREDYIKCWKEVLRLRPNEIVALKGLSKGYHALCMWDKAEECDAKLLEAYSKIEEQGGIGSLETYDVMPFSDDPYLYKKVGISQCRQILNKNGLKEAPQLKFKKRNKNNRIKVGYISPGFSNHPTAILSHAMFEHHDQSKFEVYVFAVNPIEECPFYSHIKATAENVVGLNYNSDEDVYDKLKSYELDVIIDRAGVIRGNVQGALCRKPAPIIITWLGTPSTIGAPWIDYILLDHVIAPEGFEDHYTETILRMPNSYAFNSFASIRAILTEKSEWKLPENKFIFASFNNNWKIDRDTFSAWCAILNGVDDSVLWVMIDDVAAVKNLRQKMIEEGLDSERLIVASREKFDRHYSRLLNA